MKRFCEGLTIGFSAAGAYSITSEWVDVEKSMTWWIVYIFLLLIAYVSLKFAINDWEF